MDRFLFLTILILFHTPILGYLFLRHKKLIVEKRGFILLTIVLAMTLYFIAVPLGASWGAWNYNYDKTLNIRIGSDILEILVQAILTFTILAIVILVFAEKEEKNQPLIDIFDI